MADTKTQSYRDTAEDGEKAVEALEQIAKSVTAEGDLLHKLDELRPPTGLRIPSGDAFDRYRETAAQLAGPIGGYDRPQPEPGTDATWPKPDLRLAPATAACGTKVTVTLVRCRVADPNNCIVEFVSPDTGSKTAQADWVSSDGMAFAFKVPYNLAPEKGSATYIVRLPGAAVAAKGAEDDLYNTAYTAVESHGTLTVTWAEQPSAVVKAPAPGDKATATH